MVASTVDTGELYGWGWNKYGQQHPHTHTHTTTYNNSDSVNNSINSSSNNDIYYEPIRLTGFDNLLQTAYSSHSDGNSGNSNDCGEEEEGGGIYEVVCGSRYTAILTHTRQRILVM